MTDTASQPAVYTKAQHVAVPKWSNWYLTLLKAAMALLLVLLIILLWLLRQSQVDEQRTTLIADVLWLEQSVNFRLEGNTEQITQLALDLAQESKKTELFRLRSRHLLKNNAEIQQLLWLDSTGQLLDALPTQKMPRLEQGSNQQLRSLELARKLGKPVYTEHYSHSPTPQFEVYFPVFENGKFRGALVSVYSLNTLLKEMIPWWFAEKYQVLVLDTNGETLVRNSKVSEVSTTISYTIPFDPPGFGMSLQVIAYRSAQTLVQTLITVLIISLAATVLWSLWIMRGHIRRRLDAEHALRAEHAFRKAMEDSLTVGMRARNLDGHVTYVNPAFCQMVGFSAEELMRAELPMPYWAPEELENTQLLHDAVIEGNAPREGFELRFMRKDGSRFDALIYEAPLIDADGRHTGWMASIVDVTTRKQVEEIAREQREKLQRTSRLVTMGEMASTLAHELNQPLAAITSYNAGCLNKLESGQFTHSELQDALNKLGVQAQRAGRIVRRVHDFVRKSEPKLAACDLASVIDDSIGFIDAAARLAHTKIQRQIESDCPALMADHGMLEQVFLNLMRNGLEAMSQTPTKQRCLSISLKKLKEHLEVRVSDNGCGIPPEIQEKLFTPFFTTKTEGMGMGLNICRSIIEFHHGRLWLENNPTGGSVFIMLFPMHTAIDSANIESATKSNTQTNTVFDA